jgi:hypothetical protein
MVPLRTASFVVVFVERGGTQPEASGAGLRQVSRPRMDWSDAEASAAVGEYFGLLEAERRGEPTNETLFYRQLAD